MSTFINLGDRQLRMAAFIHIRYLTTLSGLPTRDYRKDYQTVLQVLR